jgi:hypothetical protein
MGFDGVVPDEDIILSEKRAIAVFEKHGAVQIWAQQPT